MSKKKKRKYKGPGSKLTLIKEKCDVCKQTYPSRFVQPMYHNGVYYRSCPECPLKLTNRTEYSGPMAQQLLEDFREWKDEQPK